MTTPNHLGQSLALGLLLALTSAGLISLMAIHAGAL